ncbi:MAG: HAMP domain-containing histidine kinase [Burkholderiales bacterium]|nr:HAMP domain-containing histidine kinase [Burkholderiales bacterium]
MSALSSQATRALIESNAREASDLVGELTLLLDRAGDRSEEIAAARMVTRRLSDRLAQATMLERLSGAGALRPDAWSPIDLVEELEHEAVALAGSRIDVRVRAPELVPQYWFFDRELVSMTLAGALHSALIHAERAIELEFGMRDGLFGFSIADDSGCFPDALIDAAAARIERGELNGNALGVHFARLVAAAHVNAGREGRVELVNRGDGPGTRFTLWLP